MENILNAIKEKLKEEPTISYQFIVDQIRNTEHEEITLYKEITFLRNPYIYYVVTIPNIFNSNFDYKFRVLTYGDILNTDNIRAAMGLNSKKVKQLNNHISRKNSEPEPGLMEKAKPFVVVEHSLEQFASFLIINEVRSFGKIKLSDELTQELFLLAEGLMQTGNLEGFLLLRYLGGNTYNPNLRVAIMLTDSIGEFRTEYHSKEILEYRRVLQVPTDTISWGNLSTNKIHTEEIGNFVINRTIFNLIKEHTGYDLVSYLLNTPTHHYNVVTGNEIIENYLEYYYQTMEARAVINYLRRNYDLSTREFLIKVKESEQELEDFRVFQLSRINDTEPENNYNISLKSKHTIKSNRSFRYLVKDIIEGMENLDEFDEHIRKQLEKSSEEVPTQSQILYSIYCDRVENGQPSRELKAIVLYSKLFELSLDEVLELYGKIEQKREQTRLKIMLDNLDLCKTDYIFLKKQLVDYFDTIGFQQFLEFKTDRKLSNEFEGSEEIHFLMKEI